MRGLEAQVLAHPLFGVVLTLGAYVLASALWQRSKQSALLHPVLVATLFVSVVLLLSGMGHADYLAQAALLNEGLGLVVILLAVPLWRQSAAIRAAGLPLLAALGVGSAAAVASALVLPFVQAADPGLLATLAPKSATTAVAVEIAQRLGGLPGLTAVVVVSTGIFGAVFGLGILRAAGVRDDRAAGFALGLAAHAIGTARAFQLSETAGAFATIGMILNALLTVLLAPVAMQVFGGS